ncbi:hypothetical protein ABZ897_33990 [Nonomuraea sp. NPDC046802]|uniref:hypothetical protein n=1 Tax=Nonomuraea sp. NPDC046802 TaxID=3154919 RepID=UPI0033FCA7C2
MLRQIEFLAGHDGLMEIAVDGVPLLELVRQAELPYARREQLERREEFAPEPAPLLAGDYAYFSTRLYGWPERHYLGEPVEVAYNQDDDEVMLLGCTCGIAECWALLARIEVTESIVRWSGLRNNHRDWDVAGRLGPLEFSRQQYEQALRAAAPRLLAPPARERPRPLQDLQLVPVLEAAGSSGEGGWVRLSSLLGEDHLSVLVRSCLETDVTGLTGRAILDTVACLPAGYQLRAGGETLVGPGCCCELSDLAGWRDAARHTGARPSMVWIGHPWVHVSADGDDLLLTGPTEGEGGPEMAWISRTALARAVQRAAAEVRYVARPLHEACARLAGQERAAALCAALLGGSWLRSGGDWLG